MQAIQITIRAVPHSDSLQDHVRKKAEALDEMYRRISGCRVIIDQSQKNKHQGKLFKVCIDVRVPGKELVVNHKENEDVYIAIRDAFNAIHRQLETYVQKHRGDVKRHTKLNGFAKEIKEIAEDGGI
jgi:ribosomal subunit interface protein